MLNTPGGREELLKLGVRKVPCVVKGGKYVFGQNLRDVASFLGLSLDRRILPPDQLVAKFLEILAAAQRMVRQLPADKLEERVIPNRPRTLRQFSYHIFRIAESFLLTYDGAEYTETMHAGNPPEDLDTPAKFAAYGIRVRNRLALWWEATPDKACQKPVRTYYGPQVAHEVLERCTWHTAQHCRQLVVLLEQRGIQPDQPPTPELLAGLPLPEGLWE